MTRPAEVRARLVDTLRRDLVGPASAGRGSGARAALREPFALVFDRFHRPERRRGRGG